MRTFIDANILLRFYHFTSDEIEQLKILIKLHEKKDIEIITNSHLRDEVERNRESKIKEGIDDLSKALNLKLPRSAEHYEESKDHSKLSKSLSATRRDIVSQILDDAANRTLPADILIKELFEKSSFIEVDDEIFSAARTRLELDNPPGKKGQIGDRIHWETVIRDIELFNDISIVSADTHFRSHLFPEKANPMLQKEAEKANFCDVYYYSSLSKFLKSRYPQIQLPEDVERLAVSKRLINSNSFQNTHEAIAELEEYENFYVSEAEDILRASLENSQIGWIITDPDVENFIMRLLNQHRNSLPEDLVQEVEIFILIGGGPVEEID